jgi:hypothetical protein
MSRTRRGVMVVGLFGAIIAAITSAAPAATGAAGSIAAVRPVIGRPVAVPPQPLPGQRFTVSFKVKRSDTGGPLTSGKLTARSSVAGRVIPHTKSFARGTARISFVVPTNAAGRLTVKVTIAAGGRSATRVAAFRVQQLPKPSLAIDDASAAEGNGAGTTRPPTGRRPHRPTMRRPAARSRSHRARPRRRSRSAWSPTRPSSRTRRSR